VWGAKTYTLCAAAQAVRSRGALPALHSGSMAILVPLVQSHQRGHAAAQGFVPPAVDRRPTRKGRRLKGKSTGGRTEQASNTARGTPGSPAPRGDYPLCTPHDPLRAQAAGSFGLPGVPRTLEFSGEDGRKTRAQQKRAARTILFVLQQRRLSPFVIAGTGPACGRPEHMALTRQSIRARRLLKATCHPGGCRNSGVGGRPQMSRGCAGSHTFGFCGRSRCQGRGS
jgi:hypothetical protein